MDTTTSTLENPQSAVRDPQASVALAPLRRGQVLLLLVLLGASVLIRLAGISGRPYNHYTDDEYHYAWAGLSLLAEGKPTAWSMLPIGRNEGSIRMGGKVYPIVCPALDHPPLFSLLAGGFARLTGARPMDFPKINGGVISLWDVSMGRERVLPVLLFAVSFLLLFALAREYFSLSTAFVTVGLYGFIADSVIRSRLVVTESLLTPLLLLNLLCLARYLAGRLSERMFAIVTAAGVAAGVLTKLTAVVHGGILVMLLVMAGRRREVIYPLAGLAVGGGLCLAYGAWQGFGQYVRFQYAQSARFMGFDILDKFIFIPRYQYSTQFNELLFAGWVGVFWGLARRRATSALAVPLLYMIGYAYFCCTINFYEWHLLPIYPYLCLGLGLLVADAWTECGGPALITVCFVLLAYACRLIFAMSQTRPFSRPFYLLLLFLLPLIYLQGERGRVLTTRLLVGVVLGLAFIGELLFLWDLYPR